MRSIDPDADLALRLQHGDTAAITDLLARFGTRIETVAFRCLGNREDAEEVAQDVLLKVVSAIGAFRHDAALGSWIHRITLNAAVSRLRRTTARRRREVAQAPSTGARSTSPDELPPPRDVMDQRPLADDVYWGRQFRAGLRRALRALPEIYREPIELRHLQGCTTEQASARLGVTIQTVKSRLHRGRLLLRPALGAFRA